MRSTPSARPQPAQAQDLRVEASSISQEPSFQLKSFKKHFGAPLLNPVATSHEMWGSLMLFIVLSSQDFCHTATPLRIPTTLIPQEAHKPISFLKDKALKTCLSFRHQLFTICRRPAKHSLSGIPTFHTLVLFHVLSINASPTGT